MHLTANPICQQDVRQCMWRVQADALPSSGSCLNTAAKRGLVCALSPLSMGVLQSHQRLGSLWWVIQPPILLWKQGFMVLIPNFSLNFYKMKVAYFLGLQNTILSHHFVAQDVPGFACCIKGRGPCKRYKQTPIQPPSK